MSLSAWFSTPLFEMLADQSKGRKVWLVGGALRDHLLEREAIDLDFTVDKDARKLARRIADAMQGKYFDLDLERETGRVILLQPGGKRRMIDFAMMRGSDIREDLLDRDFSINALAVSLEEPDELIDPSGGLQDLKDGLVRSCNPNAFQRDPVRVLRAVRIATELNFRIEQQTLSQVKQAIDGLKRISPERIRDEIMRMLALPRPGRAVRVLDHLGALAFVLPELEELKGISQPAPHAYDVWEHTLAVVDRLGVLLGVLADGPASDDSGDLVLAQASLVLGRFRDTLRKHLDVELSMGRCVRQLLFFAALYHDAGKPVIRLESPPDKASFHGHEVVSSKLVRERAGWLRLSRAESDRLALIVRHHMRPEWLEREPKITTRAMYRFFRQAGTAGVDAILLSLADFLGKYTATPPEDGWNRRVETARQLLAAFFERWNQGMEPVPLLRGSDLIAVLELKPGPQLGQLLEAIREAQVCGEITSYDEAINLARSLIEEIKD
ncbi:MAG TPA: HD domain-containing protein [Anaerolineae bacterium]|nr:HD domain-containing protein [Anaerolineae bacterium]